MTDDRGRALLRQVARAARRRDDGHPAFLDGLLVGAMVGAAIAGSTLWSRWQARRRPRAAEGSDPGLTRPERGSERPGPG